MKYLRFAMILGTSSLLFPLLTTSAFAQLKGRWQLKKNRRGIKVYSMQVRGSRLLAVRGDATLDAPLDRVVYLLHNVSHKTKWVSLLKKAKVLHKYSPHDRVVYAHFSLPWPASHRDFVYRTKLTIDHKHKQVVWITRSIQHTSSPKTVGVRALIRYSRYILKPIQGGKKTSIRAEIHGDPKGMLPSMLVNMVQRRWPYKTMRGIQKALKKPFVRSYKPVAKAMKQWQQGKSSPSHR